MGNQIIFALNQALTGQSAKLIIRKIVLQIEVHVN